MKKLIAVAGFCVLTLIGSGCGSSSESTRTDNRRSVASGNRQINAVQAPSPPASNAGPGGANSNAQAESLLAIARNKKLDAMRKGANTDGPRMDIESILRQSARPAPENSEFAVALTETLVERRTFRNHAVLSRVEKITDGERKSISVITTDGGKFDLPGDSINTLSTVPSAAILKLLNIDAPAKEVSERKAKPPAKTNSN